MSKYYISDETGVMQFKLRGVSSVCCVSKDIILAGKMHGLLHGSIVHSTGKQKV